MPLFDTLRSVTDVAPGGSKVVFDYFESDAFFPLKAAERVQLLVKLAMQEEEPMQTGFEPRALAADLAGLGLCLEEDLNPSDIFNIFPALPIKQSPSCEARDFLYIKVHGKNNY